MIIPKKINLLAPTRQFKSLPVAKKPKTDGDFLAATFYNLMTLFFETFMFHLQDDLEDIL